MIMKKVLKLLSCSVLLGMCCVGSTEGGTDSLTPEEIAAGWTSVKGPNGEILKIPPAPPPPPGGAPAQPAAHHAATTGNLPESGGAPAQPAAQPTPSAPAGGNGVTDIHMEEIDTLEFEVGKQNGKKVIKNRFGKWVDYEQFKAQREAAKTDSKPNSEEPKNIVKLRQEISELESQIKKKSKKANSNSTVSALKVRLKELQDDLQKALSDLNGTATTSKAGATGKKGGVQRRRFINEALNFIKFELTSDEKNTLSSTQDDKEKNSKEKEFFNAKLANYNREVFNLVKFNNIVPQLSINGNVLDFNSILSGNLVRAAQRINIMVNDSNGKPVPKFNKTQLSEKLPQEDKDHERQVCEIAGQIYRYLQKNQLIENDTINDFAKSLKCLIYASLEFTKSKTQRQIVPSAGATKVNMDVNSLNFIENIKDHFSINEICAILKMMHQRGDKHESQQKASIENVFADMDTKAVRDGLRNGFLGNFEDNIKVIANNNQNNVLSKSVDEYVLDRIESELQELFGSVICEKLMSAVSSDLQNDFIQLFVNNINEFFLNNWEVAALVMRIAGYYYPGSIYALHQLISNEGQSNDTIVGKNGSVKDKIAAFYNPSNLVLPKEIDVAYVRKDLLAAKLWSFFLGNNKSKSKISLTGEQIKALVEYAPVVAWTTVGTVTVEGKPHNLTDLFAIKAGDVDLSAKANTYYNKGKTGAKPTLGAKAAKQLRLQKATPTKLFETVFGE